PIFQLHRLRELPDPLPSLSAAQKRLGSPNKRNVAMAEPVEMLEHGARARFVVHEDVADGIELDLAPNDDRRDSPALEIGKKIDIDRKPIGDDDQPLDA